MSAVRLAIAGCTGRTGATVLRLAARDRAFQVVAALTVAGDPQLGQDAGPAAGLKPLGLMISDAISATCDVLVEFTTPPGAAHWARWCGAAGVPLVSGTTGLGDEVKAALQHAAERVPVLWSANMSIGVNLLLGLVAQVAARLGEAWDVEITETHHRHKVDAPSGTAKMLLAEIARVRGHAAEEIASYGRHGQCGPRAAGQVGVHAIRMGEVVGEHEVSFASANETLTLRHRASSRDAFAAGALAAARWIIGKPAGYYTMGDVLSGA
jgi:4-hydroxy-tetrahydrodipicolinate reductase